MARKQKLNPTERGVNKYLAKHPNPGKVGAVGKGVTGVTALGGYSNARSEGYSRTASTAVGVASAAPMYAGLHAHSKAMHKAYSNAADHAAKHPGTLDKAPKVHGRLAAGVVGSFAAEHATMSYLHNHKIAKNG